MVKSWGWMTGVLALVVAMVSLTRLKGMSVKSSGVVAGEIHV